MQAPISEDLISTFIFNAILALLVFISLWFIFLLNPVTESGPGLDADVQIIFPYRKW